MRADRMCRAEKLGRTVMLDQEVLELGDAGWARVGDAVGRLEESWRRAAPAELAELAPPRDDPLFERTLVELIKIDWEYRWKSRQPKALEAYLHEWEELRSRPEALVGLVTAECLTRAMLGSLPTQAEIDSRFPEISARIDLSAIAAMALAKVPRTFPHPPATPPKRGSMILRQRAIPPCRCPSAAALDATRFSNSWDEAAWAPSTVPSTTNYRARWL